MARGARVLGVDPASTVKVNAALIVPARIAELVAWERFVHDPARVAELHQMRIAAKRLRYTMELFAPCYGTGFGKAIDRVKAIQEQLGDIHDADVLVPELRDAAARCLAQGKGPGVAGVHEGDFDAAAGLVTLCRQKRAEREATYRKFLGGWREMRTSGFFESLRRMLWEAAEPPAARQAPTEPPAGRQDETQGGSDDGEGDQALEPGAGSA